MKVPHQVLMRMQKNQNSVLMAGVGAPSSIFWAPGLTGEGMEAVHWMTEKLAKEVQAKAAGVWATCVVQSQVGSHPLATEP